MDERKSAKIENIKENTDGFRNLVREKRWEELLELYEQGESIVDKIILRKHVAILGRMFVKKRQKPLRILESTG